MKDDLLEYLGSWHAPALPERTARRITSLLDDRSLPGPLVGKPRRRLALPLAYAAAVATLVVEAPNVPPETQSTAVAVSTIDLEGFETVARPRIRVNRRTP